MISWSKACNVIPSYWYSLSLLEWGLLLKEGSLLQKIFALIITFLALSCFGSRPLEASPIVLDQDQFWHFLGQLDEVYSPVYSAHGQNLKITADFEYDIPVLEAFYREGSRIQITYSFATATAMGREVLGFALCHEFGHHLGEIKITDPPRMNWASTHNEADYYASRDCIPLLIEKGVMDLESYANLSYPPGAAEFCAHFYPLPSPSYQDCLNKVTFSFDIIHHLQKLNAITSGLHEPLPSFMLLADSLEEDQMLDPLSYPSLNCRLKTILSGFLFDSEVTTQFMNINKQRPNCWYNQPGDSQ